MLEVACGTGRNLIAMAKRWPRAELYGFDISEAMLETARAHVARAGLADRIHLAKADAGAFDAQAMFGRAAFDRVVISYALSMIPPWRAAIAQALAALAPQGELHVVDFCDQADWPAPLKRALRRWLDAFEVSPREDLATALEAAAASDGRRATYSPRYAAMRRSRAWARGWRRKGYASRSINGAISGASAGRHRVVAQGAGGHPLQLLALARTDEALPFAAHVKRHQQVEVVIGVAGEAERRQAGRLDFDAELLAQSRG